MEIMFFRLVVPLKICSRYSNSTQILGGGLGPPGPPPGYATARNIEIGARKWVIMKIKFYGR